MPVPGRAGGELEVDEGLDRTTDRWAADPDGEPIDGARLAQTAEPLRRRGEREVDGVGDVGDRRAPVRDQHGEDLAVDIVHRRRIYRSLGSVAREVRSRSARHIPACWPMVMLLGFLTGIALVAPIGPVALTLFGLGAEQGRRAALAGAGGVVLADSLTMPVALGGAGFLGGLDAGIVRWLEIAMGVALIALAIVTVVHAERARAALGSMQRPTRTLAAMTLLNPLSLVAWLGLALALPADIRTPAALAWFGVGIVAGIGGLAHRPRGGVRFVRPPPRPPAPHR